MQRILVLVLSFLVLFQSAAFAAVPDSKETVVTFRVGEPSVTISENGVSRTLPLDVAPVIIDGRTMIPLRAMTQAFGGEALWTPPTRTIRGKITLVFGELRIVLFIGVDEAYWNLSPISLPALPMILNGRTMVPLRMAEWLGATVSWNEAIQTITILQKQEDRLMVKVVDPGVRIGGPAWFIPRIQKQLVRLQGCSPEHYDLFKSVGAVNIFKGSNSEAHSPLGSDFGTPSTSFTVSYKHYGSLWKRGDVPDDGLLSTMVHEARHGWQFLSQPIASRYTEKDPEYEQQRSFDEWDAILEDNIMGLRCIGDAIGATPPDLSKVRSYTRSQEEIECFMPTMERYRNGTWPPDIAKCEAISARQQRIASSNQPTAPVAAVSLKQPQQSGP